jgi:hypothetical protein
MKHGKYILAFMFTVVGEVAYAQPAPPPPPDMQSPLDVMVVVLLAAGVIYAVRNIVSSNVRSGTAA